MRVTSVGISQHEGQVWNARWFTWGIPRKRAINVIDGVSLRPHALPNATDECAVDHRHGVARLARTGHEYTKPGQDVANILMGAKEH